MSDSKHGQRLPSTVPKKARQPSFASASKAASSSTSQFVPGTKSCSNAAVPEEPWNDGSFGMYNEGNVVINNTERRDDTGKLTHTRYWVCCKQRLDNGQVQYRLKDRPPQEDDDQLEEDELYVGGEGNWIDEECLDWVKD
ncbi:hypothetical protein HO173_004432 [Letharia columbiana]|uniref:Uncharacterized protein n=1 Tax=Letharia columbiana TaxID=112416 RepID=A0A8H6L6J3_9LECA|nr:uncharacterized protein HO173_004432 [Letharia columbiana]KAF6237542.1 hypothetical protein HO173_004432 [Letharia columbiana]